MIPIFFSCAEVAYTNRSVRNDGYGKMGIHRPTPYGVEYKSLGNWWMRSTAGCKWAYKVAIKAIEYGLDAGIVNVAHHYGQTEPAPELLELVDAYAKMDGSAEKLNKAMELMGKFCQENRKPAK